jgi:hypothetical protein
MTHFAHLLQPITLDDEYSYPLHTTGTASTLPVDQERDYGAELRAVVKEVTGEDLPAPEKQRIGFLP